LQVDRHDEILHFEPEPLWSLSVTLAAPASPASAGAAAGGAGGAARTTLQCAWERGQMYTESVVDLFQQVRPLRFVSAFAAAFVVCLFVCLLFVEAVILVPTTSCLKELLHKDAR
jgi:hypothetical protein